MNNEQIFIKGREVASKQHLDASIDELKKLCANLMYLTEDKMQELYDTTGYDSEHREKINIASLYLAFGEGVYIYKGDKTRFVYYIFNGNVTIKPNSGDMFIIGPKGKLAFWIHSSDDRDKGIMIFKSPSEIENTNTWPSYYGLPTTAEYFTALQNIASKSFVTTTVTEALADISQFSLLPVDTLPTEDIQTNVIYAVPSENPEEGNERVEWVYVNEKWECLGIRKIDLSNYYTKAEIDRMIGDINSILASMTTVEEVAE